MKLKVQHHQKYMSRRRKSSLRGGGGGGSGPVSISMLGALLLALPAVVIVSGLSSPEPASHQLSEQAAAAATSTSLPATNSSFSSSEARSTALSRSLTELLLGLDLGYNVLNSEKLRKSMGVNLDLLEEQSRRRLDRADDYIYVDDIEDDGSDDLETLPSAQALVRDRDYVQGPNPSWSRSQRQHRSEDICDIDAAALICYYDDSPSPSHTCSPSCIMHVL